MDVRSFEAQIKPMSRKWGRGPMGVEPIRLYRCHYSTGSFAASAQDYERAASLSVSQPDCLKCRASAFDNFKTLEEPWLSAAIISDAEEMKITEQSSTSEARTYLDSGHDQP